MANYNGKSIPTDGSKDIITWSEEQKTDLTNAFNNLIKKGETSSNMDWVRFENGLQMAFATVDFDLNSTSFVGYDFPLTNFKTLYIGHSTMGSFPNENEMKSYQSIVLRSSSSQWQLRAAEPYNSTRTITLFVIGIRK